MSLAMQKRNNVSTNQKRKIKNIQKIWKNLQFHWQNVYNDIETWFVSDSIATRSESRSLHQKFTI